jgi:lipoate-protein ligase A
MIFVDNQHEHDPALNLALEEYVLLNAQTDEDMLLFYVNSPSIIIGRHQNTIEEINTQYVEKHGIHIVRRLSGGGAVYHDLGNLNFSFITRADPGNFRNFKKFTEPVIEGLKKLGVPAELSGRNDILVDGQKYLGMPSMFIKGACSATERCYSTVTCLAWPKRSTCAAIRSNRKGSSRFAAA